MPHLPYLHTLIISLTICAAHAADAVTVDPGGTMTAINIVVTRTTDAAPTEVVRGDDSRLIPSGVILPSAATTAPAGWLACNGAAVSRTTYAALFAAIGTTFGAGDGSTTFNVPDLRGRTVIGSGTGVGDGASGSGLPAGTPLAARTTGQFGGEQSHTLTVAELPPHDHKLAANTTNSRSAGAPGATDSIVRGTLGGADEEYTLTKPSTPMAPTLGQSSTVGSGAAHNVMQPFVVVNYLIKQ